MPSVRIETLSWDEAESALRDLPIALLPLGAKLKEHGHHLPLNNDWLLAERLAERVAQQVDLAVLPTLQHGYYPAFVDYPGSIHLELRTAIALIVDIGRSLARHGVRRLYVLNTGVSTTAALEPARESLEALGLRMAYTDLRVAGRAAKEAVRQQPCGSHADELETSMMLHLAPEVVRMSRATRCVEADRPGPLRRDPDAPGLYSPSGVYGDATLATAEKGEILVEGLVADIVAQIRALLE